MATIPFGVEGSVCGAARTTVDEAFFFGAVAPTARERGPMGKGVEGVARTVVGDGALFVSVAEEAGVKVGVGPVVGGLVEVGRVGADAGLDSSEFF